MGSSRAIAIVGGVLIVGGAAAFLLRGGREEVPVAENGVGGGASPVPPLPRPLLPDATLPKELQKATVPPPVASPSVKPDPLRVERIKSMDNVRTMTLYYIAGGVGREKPYPSHSGKAFVLWLVASNKIDRRDPRQLAILYSPADESRSLERAGGVAAYASLTLESLKAEEPGTSALTSYAGRRNRDKEHVLSASEMAEGVPVIADLSFPDGAIIGYTSGEAKWLTREELGLGPNDPIVAGDASKSPILRHLSSD